MNINEIKEYFKSKNVLFASNGDYGEYSPLSLSLSTYRKAADDNIILLESQNGKYYGYNAFLWIFKYAIEKSYDYIIYVDADCFIYSLENLVKLFDKFEKDSDYSVSGITDGGVICHRNANCYAINPFLMFARVSKIKEYFHDGRFHFNESDEFDINRVSEKSKCSLSDTVETYRRYRIENKDFNVKHAIDISGESNDLNVKTYYGDGQIPWSSKQIFNTEPYYKIFLSLHNGKDSIMYMYGRDYPFEVDNSGITTAIYCDSDLKNDGNLVCLHTWFTRLSRESDNPFFEYHKDRIFSVGNFVLNNVNKENKNEQ